MAELDRGLLESPDISLKTPAETYSNSLALSFSTGSAAWKIPGTYQEEINCPLRAEEAAFTQTEVLVQAIVSLLSSSPQAGLQYQSLHQPG